MVVGVDMATISSVVSVGISRRKIRDPPLAVSSITTYATSLLLSQSNSSNESLPDEGKRLTVGSFDSSMATCPDVA